MADEIRLLLPEGRSSPELPDTLSAPMNGGADWLDLLVITKAESTPKGIVLTMAPTQGITLLPPVDNCKQDG